MDYRQHAQRQTEEIEQLEKQNRQLKGLVKELSKHLKEVFTHDIVVWEKQKDAIERAEKLLKGNIYLEKNNDCCLSCGVTVSNTKHEYCPYCGVSYKEVKV